MNTTEEIWGRYHANLLAFIRKRVSDKAAAEDILQDVFARIHSRIEALENSGKLESWLYQITRNAIIDFYRTRRPMDTLPEWLAQSQAESEETDRRELSLCLTPMIRQLPEKYRHAIQLSAIEGKTGKEIAELEDISLSGVKSRVQRGRALLKAMLFDCCRFEINAKNQVTGYERKNRECKHC
ncbi:MAG: RNA polymerase sigma factor SigZ [Desulfobulbaceae bacterium]|nr:MAG: RNA polymerase sigma factor SigZ [Desulfobulbaceae bacterium]